ncbi:dienelactone hydrolase family protein [Tepidiforma flava]|uniref:dienelactone hydrolase family protein n=1 Tax=Tepidiforma flava TaxID=3004094 RepID=UPI0035710B52
MVWLHHMPGWDEWTKEACRKLAHHGFMVAAPDLYCRAGTGAPEDVAAKVRAEGGVPDAQVVADAAACRDFLRALPQSNGKVGVTGTCSGGRHAYLAACLEPFDACVDLWGGGVVMRPEDLTEKRPVAPIDYTERLSCPLLGLFGEEDRAPSPEQVRQHEEALQRHGKQYEFHMYAGAGHGFFTTTGRRPTGPSRRSTAGRRSSASSASTSAEWEGRRCARTSSSTRSSRAQGSGGRAGSR